MEDQFHRPALSLGVYYRDPRVALVWLEKAFGFRRSMVITDASGNQVHAEMRSGEVLIYIGSEFTSATASPASVGGKNTASAHILLAPGDGSGLDAHCERARQAGAVIVRPPEDQFYGDRAYTAADLEGHWWSFGQPVRVVSREEAEKATGLTIEGWA